MVPGLKFYESVIRTQDKHSIDGLHIENAIQTNGIMTNDKWIKFFKTHNFNIGISLDGTQEMHDKYRVDHRGRGSFDRVLTAINRIRDAGMECGVVVTLSQANVHHAEEIYDFLAENKLPAQIVPMTKSGGARESYLDLGLDQHEYGDAYTKMYDRWFYADSGSNNYVYIMDFVLKTRAILSGSPAECVGMQSCTSSNISVDPVGDVYPCATLSGSNDARWGNLFTEDLVDIMHSPRAMTYRARKVDEQCAKCKWQHVCHGGCLARSYKFYGDHNLRDYYCPSLYKIYEHIERCLREKGAFPGIPHPNHMDNGIFASVNGYQRKTRRIETPVVLH